MNVLAVRQDNNGDVLLTGPALRALAAGAARLTLLCGPSGRAAAEALPGVDDVLCYEAPWIEAVPHATWDVLRHGHDVAIFAVGTMVLPSLAAAKTLAADGLDVTVVNCRYLKPYDEVTLAAVLADHKQILVVEEGTVVNGFGAFMSSVIARYDSSVRVATPFGGFKQSGVGRELGPHALDHYTEVKTVFYATEE